MNRYKLVKAGIDVNQGIRRFNGDKDLYEQLLQSFLEDNCLEKMLIAVENKDVQAAFDESHALKGIAGNLSLVLLHENLVPLVERFRAGSIEGSEDLVEAVKQSYEATQNALKNE